MSIYILNLFLANLLLWRLELDRDHLYVSSFQMIHFSAVQFLNGIG